MKLLRNYFVASLAVLPVLAVAAPEALAVGWTSATSVQPSSPSTAGTDNARLAANARGDQVVIWDDMQLQGSDAPTCAHSEVATRVAGGAWSAPTVVPCGSKLAIGPSGLALVFWEDGTTKNAMVATAQAGSSLGSAVIADSATATHGGLTGAVDAQGLPTIAWSLGSYGASAVYAKTANANGSWSAATTPETVAPIATGRAYGYPTLAIGPQGDAVIGVTSTTYIPANTPTTTYLFQAYSRAATPHTWTGANLIGPAPNTQLGTPLVLFDSQGRPTIAISSGYATFGVLAWLRAAGASSSWIGPQNIEAGAQYPPDMAMAVDSTGTVQLGYFFHTGTAYVHAATRAAGSATWSSPANLVSTGCGTTLPSESPSVTVDSADNALIGFSCSGTDYTFRRPPGSTTYSPFTTPAGGSSTTYTTDSNGYIIATWTAGGVLYTSVYDPVTPTVDSFGTNASPVAGQPVSFDVAGSDVWGPVSYSIDFGDGSPPVNGRAVTSGAAFPFARASGGGTVSHTYAGAGTYTATVTVTDGAANSAQTTVPVAVAAAAAAPTAANTPAVTPPPTILPPPVLSESINVFVLKDPVSVKLPGERRFHRLIKEGHLPNGTVIDTRRGRVLVVIANGSGGTDAAEFYEGVFEVNQPKKLKGLANIFLDGGGFKGCPKAPKDPHAQVAGKKLSPRRSVRHLWSKGSGKFRTVGRFSSATVRGTTWLTDDRCDGTLVRVKQGKVAVRDFLRGKTVLVRAPKSYFARAKR